MGEIKDASSKQGHSMLVKSEEGNDDAWSAENMRKQD
jgi:hypothetical protein